MVALLTPCGLSGENLLYWVAEHAKHVKPARCVIITTASQLKEQNEWAQFACKQLIDLGLPCVDFFDFEKQDIATLTGDNFLYVNGGNTFRLMHAMAQQNIWDYLNSFFARDGIYIGVSAGSAVMGRRIDFLSHIGMDPDEYDWGDKPALGFYDGLILPHADDKWSPLMVALSKTGVLEIKDGDAVVLNPATGCIEQKLTALC